MTNNLNRDWEQFWMPRPTIEGIQDAVEQAIHNAKSKHQRHAEISLFTMPSWRSRPAITCPEFGDGYDLAMQMAKDLATKGYIVGFEIRSFSRVPNDELGDVHNELYLLVSWK